MAEAEKRKLSDKAEQIKAEQLAKEEAQKVKAVKMIGIGVLALIVLIVVMRIFAGSEGEKKSSRSHRATQVAYRGGEGVPLEKFDVQDQQKVKEARRLVKEAIAYIQTMEKSSDEAEKSKSRTLATKFLENAMKNYDAMGIKYDDPSWMLHEKKDLSGLIDRANVGKKEESYY